MTIERKLLLALGLATAVASAAEQKDEYEGLRTEMTARFKKWSDANRSLSGDFTRELAAKLEAKAGGAPASGFCTAGFLARIKGVQDLFEDQAAGQQHYFERHLEESNRALTDRRRMLVNLADREKQRAVLLANLQTELSFATDQRKQLLDTMEKGNRTVGPALGDLERSIASLSARLDLLTTEAANIGTTKGSLERAKAEVESRKQDSIESLATLKVQKNYWDSYYAMRRAQVDEHCPPPPIQKVLIEK